MNISGLKSPSSILLVFSLGVKSQVVKVLNLKVRGKQQFRICSGYYGPSEERKALQEFSKWSFPTSALTGVPQLLQQLGPSPLSAPRPPANAGFETEE